MPAGPTLSKTELDLQLAAHKQWLESRGAQGQRADFSGRSLAGMDLQGADLRQAILNNVNLEGATLADAKLQSADLRLATLLNADLANADLTEAHGLAFHNLAGADLTLSDDEVGRIDEIMKGAAGMHDVFTPLRQAMLSASIPNVGSTYPISRSVCRAMPS